MARRMQTAGLAGGFLAALAAGCGGPQRAPDVIVVDTPGAVSIRGEVWADNWFAFYLGDSPDHRGLDPDPDHDGAVVQCRGVRLQRRLPLAVELRCEGLKQDDTGLEHIGRSNQQMGDGGLIAQFTDVATGATVAATNAAWRCLVIHDAPLDRLRRRGRAGAWHGPLPVRGDGRA